MNDYLTEDLLSVFLKERIPNYNPICNKGFLKTQLRPDFYYQELKVVIEFDGFLHYTTVSTIICDERKQKLCIDNNIKLIRIPYFVQLDARMVKFLFDGIIENLNGFNNYPHGFNDSKVIFPSSYCSLGIAQFKKDLEKFYIIKDEILETLKLKALEKGERMVYPLNEYF